MERLSRSDQIQGRVRQTGRFRAAGDETDITRTKPHSFPAHIVIRLHSQDGADTGSQQPGKDPGSGPDVSGVRGRIQHTVIPKKVKERGRIGGPELRVNLPFAVEEAFIHWAEPSARRG